MQGLPYHRTPAEVPVLRWNPSQDISAQTPTISIRKNVAAHGVLLTDSLELLRTTYPRVFLQVLAWLPILAQSSDLYPIFTARDLSIIIVVQATATKVQFAIESVCAAFPNTSIQCRFECLDSDSELSNQITNFVNLLRNTSKCDFEFVFPRRISHAANFWLTQQTKLSPFAAREIVSKTNMGPWVLLNVDKCLREAEKQCSAPFLLLSRQRHIITKYGLPYGQYKRKHISHETFLSQQTRNNVPSIGFFSTNKLHHDHLGGDLRDVMILLPFKNRDDLNRNWRSWYPYMYLALGTWMKISLSLDVTNSNYDCKYDIFRPPWSQTSQTTYQELQFMICMLQSLIKNIQHTQQTTTITHDEYHKLATRILCDYKQAYLKLNHKTSEEYLLTNKTPPPPPTQKVVVLPTKCLQIARPELIPTVKTKLHLRSLQNDVERMEHACKQLQKTMRETKTNEAHDDDDMHMFISHDARCASVCLTSNHTSSFPNIGHDIHHLRHILNSLPPNISRIIIPHTAMTDMFIKALTFNNDIHEVFVAGMKAEDNKLNLPEQWKLKLFTV